MDNNHINSPISFDKDLINKKSTSFEVLGEPFAKQRPKAARKGRYITIYTPSKTKNYEEKVEKSYKRLYGTYQLKGPLTVKIEAIFSIPKSAPKKRQELMLSNIIPHTKKPDCDNTGKIILDGLNGVAYSDDAIINELLITKRYGLEPKTKVTIIQNQTEE